MSEQNRLQINWVTSAGGALGAVSSAVVLSSLGAAGTLVGAAVGSLCITVGGAVYSHYLAMTKERVAAQALAARRGSRVREPVPVGAAAVPQPDHRTGSEDPGHTDRADESRSARRLLRGLPWKRIVAISAALFGIAMGLILAFELSTGRAVSTYTGGTSTTDVGTSIPGWSGTGQDSPAADLDVPLPGDVQEGGSPQEQAPGEDGDSPQEQAPAEDGDVQPEQAPAQDGDVPPEQAPAEDGDVQPEEAPAAEDPVQEPAAQPEEPAVAPAP